MHGVWVVVMVVVVVVVVVVLVVVVVVVVVEVVLPDGVCVPLNELLFKLQPPTYLGVGSGTKMVP